MDARADLGSGALQPLDLDEQERVLDASTNLFSEHGPATLTLKWVSLASGVGVDRITAQWPSIELLLAAVLDRLTVRFGQAEVGVGLDARATTATTATTAAATTATAPATGDPIDQNEVIDRFQTIIARALLDRVNAANLLDDFSLVDRWATMFQEQFDLDDRTTRYRLGQTFALEWGWRLFGPYLRVACGLPDEPEDRFLTELRKLERQILELPPVPPADQPEDVLDVGRGENDPADRS
jgi:hypothetical protein